MVKKKTTKKATKKKLAAVEYLTKLNAGEGLEPDEMANLIYPLVQVVKASALILSYVLTLSADELALRDDKELAHYELLSQTIDALSFADSSPVL